MSTVVGVDIETTSPITELFAKPAAEVTLDTDSIDEMNENTPQIELGVSPIDINDVINKAIEALNTDKDKGWMIERRQVRNALLDIHSLLNPDPYSNKILLRRLAKGHPQLLSLLVQLHTKYANLMTPKSDDERVFIQYNDMAHAAPRDYGDTPDQNYSPLQHYSRKEFADRSFAVKLACRLIDSGYQDIALEESIAVNEWIIGERTSEDIWTTEAGQAWLRDVYSETHDAVDRYLPSDLHEESRDKLGSRAVTLALEQTA